MEPWIPILGPLSSSKSKRAAAVTRYAVCRRNSSSPTSLATRTRGSRSTASLDRKPIARYGDFNTPCRSMSLRCCRAPRQLPLTDTPPGFRRHLPLLAVRTAEAGLVRIPLHHVNCINPREGIPAGDECCDRLATVRINCRESKSRAQHLCQEVLAEDRVGRYGSFLSIRLRGWKGATLIKLFDRVGRG